MMDRTSLIEEMARIIYSDSYTQYGTCTIRDLFPGTLEQDQRYPKGILSKPSKSSSGFPIFPWSTAHPRTDTMSGEGFYSSPMRDGVYDYSKNGPTEEFLGWSQCFIGSWEFYLETSRMIRFSDQADQVAYLLRWTDPVNFDQIMVSMIRHSIPTAIANDIIGVQPMTGPASQIFALRSRYLNPSDDQDDAP